MKLKRDVLLLGLIDKQPERKFGPLFFYIITAARIVDAEKWRDA